jgi:hypothetical protein
MLQLKIDVQGIQPLIGKLDMLTNSVRRRILRRANVSAARPVRSTARKTAAFVDRSGLLRQALILRTKTYGTGIIASVIGVDRNARGIYRGKKRVPANYGHLVELGHRIAVGRRGGSVRDAVLLQRGKKFLQPGQTQAVNAGQVQGRPFVGPALQVNVSGSIAKFAQTFRRNVELEASR